jgi:hypothetical protein
MKRGTKENFQNRQFSGARPHTGGVSNISTRVDSYLSRDSAVGIATGYGLDDRGVGVLVPVGSKIFYSPRRLDRLWGPPSLLSNGYQGIPPRR